MQLENMDSQLTVLQIALKNRNITKLKLYQKFTLSVHCVLGDVHVVK